MRNCGHRCDLQPACCPGRALHFEQAFHVVLKVPTVNLLVYRFFVCFLRKKCLLFHHLKKKLKDKKKRRVVKDASISGKRAALAMFFCFLSLSWIKEHGSQETSPRSNNLVVSYRKEETPTFSTDTTYCSVQDFLCQKKEKKEKKEKKKRASSWSCRLLSDAVL